MRTVSFGPVSQVVLKRGSRGGRATLSAMASTSVGEGAKARETTSPAPAGQRAAMGMVSPADWVRASCDADFSLSQVRFQGETGCGGRGERSLVKVTGVGSGIRRLGQADSRSWRTSAD